MTSRYQGSLSIRPSYGARGEEILDGGGGRGRRETPDTQAITKVALLCKEKTTWDAEIALQIAKKWSKWENNLPDQVKEPRSLAVAGEEIREITLHAFGDTSGQGLAV